MLYKILSALPAEARKDNGIGPKTVLPLVPLDLKDGFIHLSTEDQLAETLNRFFPSVDQVVILEIDALGDKDAAIPEGKTGNKYRSQIKWEWVESRQSYFPHLYGDLINEDIIGHKVVKKTGDKWVL